MAYCRAAVLAREFLCQQDAYQLTLSHFDGRQRVRRFGVKPTAPRARVSKRQAELIAHEVQRALSRLGRDFEALGNRARVRIAMSAQLVVDPKDARKVSQSLVAGWEPHRGHDGKHILSDEHGQAMSYRSAVETEPIRENLLGTQRQGLIDRLG